MLAVCSVPGHTTLAFSRCVQALKCQPSSFLSSVRCTHTQFDLKSKPAFLRWFAFPRLGFHSLQPARCRGLLVLVPLHRKGLRKCRSIPSRLNSHALFVSIWIPQFARLFRNGFLKFEGRLFSCFICDWGTLQKSHRQKFRSQSSL